MGSWGAGRIAGGLARTIGPTIFEQIAEKKAKQKLEDQRQYEAREKELDRQAKREQAELDAKIDLLKSMKNFEIIQRQKGQPTSGMGRQGAMGAMGMGQQATSMAGGVMTPQMPQMPPQRAVQPPYQPDISLTPNLGARMLPPTQGTRQAWVFDPDTGEYVQSNTILGRGDVVRNISKGEWHLC